MQFMDFKSLLYSDTLIPDIFMSEYLPALKGEYVKLYVYCAFLAKHNKTPSLINLARILDMPLDTVKKGMMFLDNLDILSWNDEGVVLKDLKEKEINRYYRPKTLSTPEEASSKGQLNIKRRQVIVAINNTFFNDMMSGSWYADIDTWFDMYRFEEDVMMQLFQHCYDNNGLARHYIAKVAENWHRKGIQNTFELDSYMEEYVRMKDISKKIQKKLRLRKPLDEYQEEIVEKWVSVYKCPFEIIEEALKSSTYATSVGFTYYDKILGDWHRRGIDTVEKIKADREARKAALGKGRQAQKQPKKVAGGRAAGFDQREYEEGFYDRFISSEFRKDKLEGEESEAEKVVGTPGEDEAPGTPGAEKTDSGFNMEKK